jgi:hypothetical protein
MFKVKNIEREPLPHPLFFRKGCKRKGEGAKSHG